MFNEYLNKINKFVDAFCKTFFEEYDAKMGMDFCAFLDENVIQWSLLVVEKDADSFYKNFVSRFPIVEKFSLFTLCLLHEIGHFETEDEMEDDTEIRNTITDEEEYYNLHNEKIATDWAGYWIETHPTKAKRFDTEIKKLLKEFYESVITE